MAETVKSLATIQREVGLFVEKYSNLMNTDWPARGNLEDKEWASRARRGMPVPIDLMFRIGNSGRLVSTPQEALAAALDGNVVRVGLSGEPVSPNWLITKSLRCQDFFRFAPERLGIG